MKATVYLKHHFDAAHFLSWHPGKCKNMHGHRWTVEVWIRGNVNENGIVVDFGDIKTFIEGLDHSIVNGTIDNPTAENIAIWISECLPASNTVRVWETENAYAEVSN